MKENSERISSMKLPVIARTGFILAALAGAVTMHSAAWQIQKAPAAPPVVQTQPLPPQVKQIDRGQLRPIPTPTLPPLSGWVDLHTHPMSNLAFGGKLFHGGVDAGSLLPAVQMSYDPQCRFDVPARDIKEALSDDAPTHGDNFQSRCGDALRKIAVGVMEMDKGVPAPGHRTGMSEQNNVPDFRDWPKWNDPTHQKMWVEWIDRARTGGLRVLVALSHNSRTLANILGSGGPVSGVKDDKGSSDLQIDQIKRFVDRHPDIMKVALSAADVYQIVQQGKIAIILGVEIDNIGNFNRELAGLPDAAAKSKIQQEIQRLYGQGVRYIFPIHTTDNVFGGAAIYDAKFNVQNFFETGAWWVATCSAPGEGISFKLGQASPSFLRLFPSNPGAGPIYQDCLGHKNSRGLDPNLGVFAVKEMMKLGMIIDIDHMSDKAEDDMLRIAEAIPGGGYPLVSGHSGIRGTRGDFNTERMITTAKLRRIACLQGMFGMGTDHALADEWGRQYIDAFREMSKPFNSADPTQRCQLNQASLGPGSVAFGTDTNSLVQTPIPTGRNVYVMSQRFPTSPGVTGNRLWNYQTDGVAHYGMFAEFVKDVSVATNPAFGMTGPDLVDNHLMRSADYFFRMWSKIEAQRNNVR